MRRWRIGRLRLKVLSLGLVMVGGMSVTELASPSAGASAKAAAQPTGSSCQTTTLDGQTTTFCQLPAASSASPRSDSLPDLQGATAQVCPNESPGAWCNVEWSTRIGPYTYQYIDASGPLPIGSGTCTQSFCVFLNCAHGVDQTPLLWRFTGFEPTILYADDLPYCG